jgi:hypothetical protein
MTWIPRAEGLFKEERIITSAQQADITVGGSRSLTSAPITISVANHPELIAAAKSDGQPRLRHGLRALYLRYPGQPQS